MSSTQNMKSKTFQIFWMESRRLTASFEGLDNSLAQSPSELRNSELK